ncbi:MAG TPA: vWA domain-containing protein [Kofleriaceae bacterium]
MSYRRGPRELGSTGRVGIFPRHGLRGIVGLLLLAACGSGSNGGGGGGDDQTPDDACVGPTCKCARETLKIEAGLAPNVMLVVDASSSMNYPYGAAGSPTRWTATVQSLTNLVTNLDGQARFALSYFPIDEGCATGAPDVPFGATSAAQIRSSLASSSARGYTPTYGALREASTALAAMNDPNPELIILATDGLPNCGCVNGFGEYCPQQPTCPSPCRLADGAPDPGDAAAMVTKLYQAGIATYVIGIAFPQSEATLTDYAQRGGTTRYYPAQSSVELEQALATVGQRIVSCTLELTSPPHDPNLTNILIDGVPIPRSTTNGWEFVGGERGVVIYGSYCDQLQTGTHDVTAVYDCPVVI